MDRTLASIRSVGWVITAWVKSSFTVPPTARISIRWGTTQSPSRLAFASRQSIRTRSLACACGTAGPGCPATAGRSVNTFLAKAGGIGHSYGPQMMTSGLHGNRGSRTLFRVGHGLGNRAYQLAHELVELRVLNEMGGLLAVQRASQYTRKAEQSFAAARQTVGGVVFAYQLRVDFVADAYHNFHLFYRGNYFFLWFFC